MELKIKIAEERKLPYFGYQSRFLDLTTIEDINILQWMVSGSYDFKITHIKGIHKREDGSFSIKGLTFKGVGVVDLK